MHGMNSMHEFDLRRKYIDGMHKVDRSKTKQDAFMEYKDGRDLLRRWGRSKGETSASLSALAKMRLEDKLKTHKLYEVVTVVGDSYRMRANKPLEHP
jgi:hypothetical protein